MEKPGEMRSVVNPGGQGGSCDRKGPVGEALGVALESVSFLPWTVVATH